MNAQLNVFDRQLSIAEAIKLGARDVPTFGQIFFPKTLRQTPPQFHFDMSYACENRDNRMIGFKVFRGGAKTTFARVYIAKRVAYCISRFIVLVNINQGKAIHSLRWLKRAVEFNQQFRETFKLRKGDKWADDWITIINSQGETVNVVAAGMTSGLRGFNIDDVRPDFIFCDDISDAENTATEEARLKTDEIIFGQLLNSLSPESESPMSQFVIAQTPINAFDAISKAGNDPEFKVIAHSCFGPDGQSAWPARWTTDKLLAKKAGYIKRNQLAMWLAEMECQLVSAETQAFDKNWLKYFQVTPAEGRVAICCDPASSEDEKADFFAIAAILFWKRKAYLLEYHLERGLMPDAATAKIFEYALRYSASELVVETTGYQKILAWYFEQEMKRRRIWMTIHKVDDKRNKDDRMVQAITSIAPFGDLLIRDGMPEFEEVFELYGPGYKGKVDLLDAVSMGIIWNFGRHHFGGEDVEGEFQRLRDEDNSHFPEDEEEGRTDFRGAP